MAPAQCTPQWLPGIGGATSAFGGFPQAQSIHAMTTMPNGDLVVTGSFTLIGGMPAGGIARWNGSWSTMGSMSARALAVLPNGDLVAAGTSVARWTGSSWAGLGIGITGTTVNTLAVLPNGNLVAGGSFTSAGGVAASNLAVWDGTSWSSLGGGTNGVVQELRVLQNGDLIVGGDFTQVGAVPANDIARWNGTSWSALGAGIGGSPSVVSTVLELPNGDLIVGGDFTTAGGVAANYVARWDGSWHDMGALTVGGSGHLGVRALEQDATGTIFAGGMFGTGGLGGDSRLAHWTGTSWVQDVGGSSSSYVEALHKSGSILFVAGLWLDLFGNSSLARWGCAGQIANATSYGTACGQTEAKLYEVYDSVANPFDRSQSTLRLSYVNGGYSLTNVAGAPTWFTPVTAALPLTDDSLTGVQTLPFAFQSPVGSQTQIDISSNGKIFFDGTPGDPVSFYNNIVGALNGSAFCPLFGDWDPATGTGAGTIHLDVDIANQVAYVTWQDVQVFDVPGTTSSFQVAIFANGNVEYRYQDCALDAVPALTGCSIGNYGSNGLAVDFSAGGPFALFPPSNAPNHSAVTRPMLGTTSTLQTMQLPGWCPLGGTILSVTQYDPGISLSAIGAPGCFLFADLDVVDLAVPSAGQLSYSLTVPNNPTLAGIHVFSQGFAFVPGINAFNTITANGLDLLIGYP